MDPGLVDWMRRARRLIPKDDLRVLLSPPRLVARFARFSLHRHARRPPPDPDEDVTRRDPELCELMMDLTRLLGRVYFRVRFEGIENLPASGPALLVGNHNGGLLPMDAFFTALAIHDRFGKERAMYALVHDFVLDDPLLIRYAARLGMLRAGHGSAHAAFSRGHLVLVYPGSDLETFRTFRDRGKVVLGGRKGFLKLALREQVPIVPVVSAGTHEQFVVLARGDRLARLVHAHAWARTEVLPIVLAMPWGVTAGFVPYLPLPAQTTIAFGAPLRFSELGPDDADRPEALARCYADVEGAMQSMLTRLSEDRRFLLGRRDRNLPRDVRPPRR
ncbi:MAG TPA: 1-acyl-sn-glycerol-3-phosphate acyltransferase [Minicystis sp.]|nr:1-acyl-sn-glycerol-3-phosphate acyltransferase [Minicystis sp.]